MNKKLKAEKYRKLSVTTLVTGIMVVFIGAFYSFLWMLTADFMQSFVDAGMMPYIIIPALGIVLGCAITAVVCGGIDLKKIKAGFSSRKGKGFDITGIVLGGFFIFMLAWFMLGEILVPH